MQRHLINIEQKVLVILEGRDAAGKERTIKRVTRHLMPRETRIVALGEPSDRDRKYWFFQRHVSQLLVSGELVLFNRSWYRAEFAAFRADAYQRGRKMADEG